MMNLIFLKHVIIIVHAADADADAVMDSLTHTEAAAHLCIITMILAAVRLNAARLSAAGLSAATLAAVTNITNLVMSYLSETPSAFAQGVFIYK